ncbi:MAG: hypothetical protein SGJ07_10290 [Rhodospirillaceae bacterium]|nr:hypothetical protein [Rhodospirillaceae bacterium]
MTRPTCIVAWSSGKDSAWTLHRLRHQGEHEPVGLLTTINETHARVAMHAVRETLLEKQAEAAGLTLHKVQLPWPCPNEVYETRMGEAMERFRRDGVAAVAFGDLYLEDVRRYREEKLAGSGIRSLFPLWGEKTDRLARDMIAGGLRAYVTCVDPKQLDPRFVGRWFDEKFLDALPAGVDPCGENGEFHSFACAGPMFTRPIAVEPGEIVERDGFAFADLLPAGIATDDQTGGLPAPTR